MAHAGIDAMPVVSEERPPKRRGARWWTAALVFPVLMLVAMFAWSWCEPVGFDLGPGRLVFGASYGNVSHLGPGWHQTPNFWELVIELPGRSGLYSVSWVQPRESR